MTPDAIGGKNRKKRQNTHNIDNLSIWIPSSAEVLSFTAPIDGGGLFDEINTEDISLMSPTNSVIYAFITHFNQQILEHTFSEINTIVFIQIPLKALIEYYNIYGQTITCLQNIENPSFNYQNPFFALHTLINLNLFHPIFYGKINIHIFSKTLNNETIPLEILDPHSIPCLEWLKEHHIIQGYNCHHFETIQDIEKLILPQLHTCNDFHSCLKAISKTQPAFQYISTPTKLDKNDSFYTSYMKIKDSFHLFKLFSKYVSDYNAKQPFNCSTEKLHQIYISIKENIDNLIDAYQEIQSEWNLNLHPDELDKQLNLMIWIQTLTHFHLIWILSEITYLSEETLEEHWKVLFNSFKNRKTRLSPTEIRKHIEQIRSQLNTSQYSCFNIENIKASNIQPSIFFFFNQCFNKIITNSDSHDYNAHITSILEYLSNYIQLYQNLQGVNNENIKQFSTFFMSHLNIYELPYDLFMHLLITCYKYNVEIHHNCYGPDLTKALEKYSKTVIESEIERLNNELMPFYNPPLTPDEIDFYNQMEYPVPVNTPPTQNDCKKKYAQLENQLKKLEDQLTMIENQEQYSKYRETLKAATNQTEHIGISTPKEDPLFVFSTTNSTGNPPGDAHLQGTNTVVINIEKGDTGLDVLKKLFGMAGALSNLHE